MTKTVTTCFRGGIDVGVPQLKFWSGRVPSLTGRAQHHIITVFWSNMRVEIIAHIRLLVAVIDFLHCTCCIFEIQTTKPFTVANL